MTHKPGFRTEIDGCTATAEALSPLAFAGFAHFTAMQVREGAVRGLDLHLARLRKASLAFFGQAMPDELVLARLRNAVAAGPDDLSLTATMFSRPGEFTATGAQNDPALLVRTAPAHDGPNGPLSLALVAHERPFAEIKHVGEASKTHYLRQAVAAGFDDAAFVDGDGKISEATIWNLAFWDGEAVVWPEAAMLKGVTMSIVSRQLERLGVAQRQTPIRPEDLAGLKGAAVMNSWTPGVAVNRIGEISLPTPKAFIDRLHAAYAMEPAVSL